MADLLRLFAGEASAIVDPRRGGAIASLAVRGQELLLPPTGAWRPYPRWGSFLMAPWVGPLSDGLIRFRGRTHQLPPNEAGHANHGLVAGVAWKVIDASDAAVALERSLEGLWPFGGTVRQEVTLAFDGITLAVEIQAGHEPMPAAAGWHPWFRRGTRGSSVHVVATRYLRHVGVLPTGALEAVEGETDLRAPTSLGDRRIDVVYVEARSPAIFVTDDVDLRMEFGTEIDTVVVYTPPEAVCVEPWSAWPDAHRLGELGHSTGLVELEAGETFRRWTRWRWGEPPT